MSARAELMTALKKLCQRAGAARYFVKRGFIDWRYWDYETKPWAISIMMDEQDLLSTDGSGRITATVTLESFTRIKGEVAEIDDLTLDEMCEHVRDVVLKLQDERSPSNLDYPIIFKLEKSTSKIVEAHDADLKIQGLTASFTVQF